MSILVIDDDVLITNLVARILKPEGQEVLVVNKPEDAMAVAEAAGDVDLIISDAVMPGISGPELVEQLVQKYPRVKVLFMTGLGRFPIQVSFGGTCEFIQKPFRAAELVKTVKAMMDVQASNDLSCSAVAGT